MSDTISQEIIVRQCVYYSQNLLYLSFSLCKHVCVVMHIFIHVCEHVYMWRPVVDVRYIPPSVSFLNFGDQISHYSCPPVGQGAWPMNRRNIPASSRRSHRFPQGQVQLRSCSILRKGRANQEVQQGQTLSMIEINIY